jgi:hypothetical protein
MQWIYSFILVSMLSGCALFEERSGPATMFGPREQVYYATYEEVWRAVNFVLQPYPLRISNMDQGTLETDMIRGYRVWSPPYKSESSASAEAYRLTIRVIKGAPLAGKPATKVTIVKEVQLQRDFFSDPQALPSDGLEEKSVLYRIGREIQIERAIARAQRQGK